MDIDFNMDDDSEYTIKSNLEVHSKPSKSAYYKAKNSSPCNENHAHQLKCLTEQEIQKAFKKQLHYKWTFYNERAFIENLLSNRFNFLLLTYSFIVISIATIYATSSSNTSRVLPSKEIIIMIILGIGSLVITLINKSIFKIYAKLMVILKINYKLGDYHVFPIVKKELDCYINQGNVNPIIGIVVPTILNLSLMIPLIFLVIKTFNPHFFGIIFLIILPYSVLSLNLYRLITVS